MDIYKLKFTRLQNEILRLLSIKAGEKLNQRTIAKMLKVSPTAIAKSLSELEKENLITISKDKNMNLNQISFNRNNERAIQFKRSENLKLIYESGLADYLEEIFAGSTIILFGSYSKGEDTTKSDIDFAIINAKNKNIDQKSFEKSLERLININCYKSFKEIKKELKENIFNGIVLSGGINL